MRPRIQIFHLDFKTVRISRVVGIKEGKIFAIAIADRGIPGGGSALVVFEPNHPQPSIALKILQDRPALVGRTVIDCDELPVTKSLCQNAPNRFLQKSFAVVHRHDDRDSWHTVS